MSVARSVLDALVGVLAAAAARSVVIDTGQAVTETDPVLVRVLSLDRVGRSRREGPLLDLSLVVEVLASGPQALETLEQLIVAVERSPWCAESRDVPAADRSAAGTSVKAGPSGSIGFTVRLPVVVPMAEPVPSLVTQLPVVRIDLVRSAQGSLVDPDGRGISGAVVRSSSTGAAGVTDATGRFRLLTAQAPTDVLVAEVDGRVMRSVEAQTRVSPLVIEWSGTDSTQ